MRRVTLDSNVIISALHFGGAPLSILKMAVAGEIEIAISEPIIEEVVRVLRDKFKWQPERAAQAEGTIRELGKLVTPSQQLSVVRSDPDDDRIVECALAGKCVAIVTGDKDLLRLGSYEDVKIITVRDLLQRGRGEA